MAVILNHKIVLQPHEDNTFDCIMRYVNGLHTVMQEIPFEDDTKDRIISLLKAYKVKEFELIIVGQKKTGGQNMTPQTFKGIKSLSYINLVKQLKL